MKIEQTSYLPEFTSAIITIYMNGDDYILEMCENGKIINTTINDFTSIELKEIKTFIEKAIKYKEE